MVLLVGCGSQDVDDGAPLHAVGPDDVADAVPRADPILSSGNASPYQVNGVEYHVLSDYQGYRERGVASWYGTRFHGRQTSNGEIFDLYAATAAHKSLPIPCYVEVTNQQNGRSIIVRVNDRGPFHGDRLIDLSYGAAVKLGFAEQGTTPVEVRLVDVAGVDDRRLISGDRYRYLQVGAFGNQQAALQLRDRLLAQLAAPVEVSPVQADGAMLYRVRIGPVEDNTELEAMQKLLEQRGYGTGQQLP